MYHIEGQDAVLGISILGIIVGIIVPIVLQLIAVTFNTTDVFDDHSDHQTKLGCGCSFPVLVVFLILFGIAGLYAWGAFVTTSVFTMLAIGYVVEWWRTRIGD